LTRGLKWAGAVRTGLARIVLLQRYQDILKDGRLKSASKHQAWKKTYIAREAQHHSEVRAKRLASVLHSPLRKQRVSHRRTTSNTCSSQHVDKLTSAQESTGQAVLDVTLETYIREVFGSSPGWDIVALAISRWFPWSRQASALIVPPLHHERFLPDPFSLSFISNLTILSYVVSILNHH
jgi:hypothetical protein